MARVPDEVIEQLKREVSLVDLVEARGVELRRHGRDLIGLCPFHDDREPSLVITPEKNLWHCLGACGEGGSVIDWVMKAEGVSFRHAVELLRAETPVLTTGRGRKQGTKRALPCPVDACSRDPELLDQVVGYYHETLKESPEALEYLAGRGLESAEMIDRFRLGFANRTLGLRLPARNRAAGSEIRSRLQEVGIIRSSGHEHFNGSVVIPVFSPEGKVVEIYGRKITPTLRKGTPRHLYLPGPHRGVWNIEALTASREIILCEALIDALTFWCAGHRNVTASYGTEGFTPEHLEAFKAHGTERVLIAYDRDEAGERAAQNLAKKLTGEGIECFRVQFPRGMDAGEYACKVKPASKSLEVLIRGALWLGKGQAPPRPISQPEPEDAAKEERPPVADPSLAAVEGPAEPASPLPPVPEAPKVAAERDRDEVTVRLGDRRYRVRGLARNLSYDLLKVNLLASRGDGFHVDTLDLYAARHREGFVRTAAVELGVDPAVIKRDLGKVLLKLEELQDEQIKSALEPKSKPVSLTEPERETALELLRSPDLVDRILGDFERCGLVGEEVNKLTGYLAAVSRKLTEPLAVVVQSSSSAGKSALMEAVLELVPSEDRVVYSAMTGQSLFYMGEADLEHKILAIVEEEGAERASYALKLLQSEGELTIASTGKDPSTGRLVTHEYRVSGPVMIFLTTTAIDIDEELLNRCLVLTVDEDREQTRAIHRLQRRKRTLEGLLARRDSTAVRKLHRDAQRLLRPLAVVNPFAPGLTFLDTQTRTRRDHEKYLTLIDSIALLNQYQRPVKRAVGHAGEVEYVEVTLGDIELANRIAHEVLGRGLDELPPQTRRLLDRLDRMVTSECARLAMDRSDYRFSRREVRERTGMGLTQCQHHLRRLEEMEYLLVHQGSRGRSYEYELVYEGSGGPGGRLLPGLIDVEKLRGARYDGNLSGLSGDLSGPGGKKSAPNRVQIPPISGACRGGPAPREASGGNGSRGSGPPDAGKAGTGPVESVQSYVPRGRSRIRGAA